MPDREVEGSEVVGSKIAAFPPLLSASKYPFLGAVKKDALALPDAPNVSESPEIGFIDDLQTFVGKKNKLGLWTNVNLFRLGILAWVLGSC
ncbi:hypothetical protein QUB70_10170 [Microcoleus sp. A003_D6]|uniref:hypothetical protein n=1 Tax=Microcoleus sp. A003_D6 TaxID=3055266 RepID=UPI002FD31FE6